MLAMKQKHRFINMKLEQVERRAERERKRKYRAGKQTHHTQKKRKCGALATDVAAEHVSSKKPRPCCGRHQSNCSCEPPKGMKKMQMTALAKRFAETALCTVGDTTDVSEWQDRMELATEQLPLRVLLAYAHTHVVFNQAPLLETFIEQKAFLFKEPWFDWRLLQSIVEKHKKAGNVWRSSNYRSITLKKLRPQSHLGAPRRIPKNGVARDVLACRVVGSMPCLPQHVTCMMHNQAVTCGRSSW